MKKHKIIIVALLIFILISSAIGIKTISNDNTISSFSGFLSAFEEDQAEEWNLVLVNSKNSLPENYDIELTKLSNGVCVDERIYPPLQQMFDDARSQGVNPTVREGFRTRDDQKEIMKNRINKYISEGYSKSEAKRKAGEEVALPGTSEHELGLAVDINAGEGSSSEQVYSWLSENAHKYGFILRYPSGKEEITGIEYEPWHYRYVGKEAAKEINKKQITLEEYLKKLS